MADWEPYFVWQNVLCWRPRGARDPVIMESRAYYAISCGPLRAELPYPATLDEAKARACALLREFAATLDGR